MYKILYTPDAADGGGTDGGSQPTDTHVRHQGNVPKKDSDLLNVCTLSSAKWAVSPEITLVYKLQTDFETDTLAFKGILEERNSAGGMRPQETQALENLDIEIEDAVPYVKSYINEKFGPANGPSHYAEFGIVHSTSHGYELPRDRQKRTDALRMMVDAIHNNSFDAKTYGTAFWTDINTRYAAAQTTATGTDSNVSDHVGDLVTMRTSLRRVLHSILLVLEGNYPDTFDEVRRAWGFQKEKY